MDDWGEWLLTVSEQKPKAVDPDLEDFKRRINRLYRDTRSFSLAEKERHLSKIA